jgi:hypothetical protein
MGKSASAQQRPVGEKAEGVQDGAGSGFDATTTHVHKSVLVSQRSESEPPESPPDSVDVSLAASLDPGSLLLLELHAVAITVAHAITVNVHPLRISTSSAPDTISKIAMRSKCG